MLKKLALVGAFIGSLYVFVFRKRKLSVGFEVKSEPEVAKPAAPSAD